MLLDKEVLEIMSMSLLHPPYSLLSCFFLFLFYFFNGFLVHKVFTDFSLKQAVSFSISANLFFLPSQTRDPVPICSFLWNKLLVSSSELEILALHG